MSVENESSVDPQVNAKAARPSKSGLGPAEKNPGRKVAKRPEKRIEKVDTINEPSNSAKNGSLKTLIDKAPMLKKLFGPQQTWLLILAALPLPMIAYSPNPIYVLAWSSMVLTTWVLGQIFGWFE